ncbi:hypothetical protein H1R20_g2057, partial [Candolleomyces eurysporus]
MGRRQGRVAPKKKKEEGRGRPGAPKDDALNAGGPERTRSRSRLRSGPTNRKAKKNEKKKEKKKVGLFVTKELATAIETTKATVERIAKECRLKNRRFRDPEFDLEYDKFRCLHGYSEFAESSGRDVQRVTEIFDKPQFFPPGGAATSNAIHQGELGDCYFLSALATVSGFPGLIEKICVARDEEVGIYGFIFYQDKGWVSVIIDDMLFTNIPKYESLDQESKAVFHEDKERFETMARKGGQTLVYARSGTKDETWVPLLEKAYAKLYGCFAHLDGGQTREAIEDLTGGVASCLPTRDLLDVDRFWKEELLRVNKDRLFACAFDSIEAPEDAPWAAPDVQGLYGGHAYAVLRAAEINGKRFVVLRNPWGKSEWTGPWGDGSKEWTPEWLKILPQLNHSFGDDGQFVMEYKDFLRNFTEIDRVLLFNESWTVASSWLTVPVVPIPSAPSYGMLSFAVTIPKKAKSIIVLAKMNNRAFRSLAEKFTFTFEFSVVKVGESVPLVTSTADTPWSRSGNLDLELEAGDYMVYVKIIQSRALDPAKDYEDWKIPPRQYPELVNPFSKVISKILTSKVNAMSLTQNWDGMGEIDFKVKSIEEVIQDDLEEMKGDNDDSDEEDEDEDEEESESGSEEEDEGGSDAGVDTGKPASETGDDKKKSEDDAAKTEGVTPGPDGAVAGEVVVPVPDDDSDDEVDPTVTEWIDILENKDDEAVVGLKVYTQTKEPAVISGRIKSEDVTWVF